MPCWRRLMQLGRWAGPVRSYQGDIVVINLVCRPESPIPPWRCQLFVNHALEHGCAVLRSRFLAASQRTLILRECADTCQPDPQENKERRPVDVLGSVARSILVQRAGAVKVGTGVDNCPNPAAACLASPVQAQVYWVRARCGWRCRFAVPLVVAANLWRYSPV